MFVKNDVTNPEDDVLYEESHGMHNKIQMHSKLERRIAGMNSDK